jgi:hypothetical protein
LQLNAGVRVLHIEVPAQVVVEESEEKLIEAETKERAEQQAAEPTAPVDDASAS